METTKLTPYEKSLLQALSNLNGEANSEEIMDELRGMGWTGPSLILEIIETKLYELRERGYLE